MNEYKVTYYVGAMLAQGGVLEVKEDRLVFAPRALERAMGAQDVVVPYTAIKMVEVTGTLTESLMVRTSEKAHRFVGGDLYKIRDRINAGLQIYQHRIPVMSPDSPLIAATQVPPSSTVTAETQAKAEQATMVKPSTDGKCPDCSKDLRNDFNFCPYCQKSIRFVCPGCTKAVEKSWKYCAYCSHAL